MWAPKARAKILGYLARKERMTSSFSNSTGGGGNCPRLPPSGRLVWPRRNLSNRKKLLEYSYDVFPMIGPWLLWNLSKQYLDWENNYSYQISHDFVISYKFRQIHIFILLCLAECHQKVVKHASRNAAYPGHWNLRNRWNIANLCLRVKRQHNLDLSMRLCFCSSNKNRTERIDPYSPQQARNSPYFDDLSSPEQHEKIFYLSCVKYC